MDRPCIYVVRSVRSHGNVTYNCPTAEWALKKLRDFSARGDMDITVLDPDGNSVSEADLVNCVSSSHAPPVEEALPTTP